MITAIADDVVIHYTGRFIVKQVMAPLDATTKVQTSLQRTILSIYSVVHLVLYLMSEVPRASGSPPFCPVRCVSCYS